MAYYSDGVGGHGPTGIDTAPSLVSVSVTRAPADACATPLRVSPLTNKCNITLMKHKADLTDHAVDVEQFHEQVHQHTVEHLSKYPLRRELDTSRRSFSAGKSFLLNVNLHM